MGPSCPSGLQRGDGSLFGISHARVLGEAHDIDFTPDGADFANSMRRRSTGETPTQAEMWSMLGGFFPSEMHRQTLVPHAAEALARLSEVADIVVLTNLLDSCRTARIDQLAAFGIHHRVECNQGGKGDPVSRLVEEHGNPVTVFVDDLAVPLSLRTIIDVLGLPTADAPRLRAWTERMCVLLDALRHLLYLFQRKE